MSRAKKTKRTKKYSAQHLYRHFTDLANHAKKSIVKPTQPTKSIHGQKESR